MADKTTEQCAPKWAPPPAGSPCWIEIPAVDVAACKAFYSALFPSWDFKPLPEGYNEEKIAMYDFAQPAGLTGGIVQMSPSCKTEAQKNGVGMTVHYFTESIEKLQEKVLELGGSTCVERTPEGKNGWYAKFKDVEGNIFGAYEVKM